MTRSIISTVESPALRDLLDSGAPLRLLDVRSPGEFEAVHIPGAYNAPLEILREHRHEIRNHLGEKIVLVCQAGQRAAQAGESLRAAGLANVHVLDGGMAAWERNGFAVKRGAQRWDLERQVRLVAGSIVFSSILGSLAVPRLKWLAAGVGAGLAYAALSNSCAMGMLLSRLPYNRGPSCDAQAIVEELVDTQTDYTRRN